MSLRSAKEIVEEVGNSRQWPTLLMQSLQASSPPPAPIPSQIPSPAPPSTDKPGDRTDINTRSKAAPKKQPQTISSGFETIDKLSGGGLRPGEVTVLAGLPGVGKTTLAINMTGNAAVKDKRSTAFFSLDMNRDEIILKLISSRAGVSLDNIYSGFIIPEDRPLLDETLGAISASPLYIDDSGQNTTTSIKATLTENAEKLGLQLVVIDCVQLLTAKHKTLLSEKELSGICSELKKIALEFELPIIALYQLPHTWLSKKVVPHPAFLINKGFTQAIGADRVIFIYRESVCKFCDSPIELCVCPEPHKAHIIVAGRDGKSNVIDFKFSTRLVRFEEPDVKNPTDNPA